jgi:CBS domain-containing protein
MILRRLEQTIEKLFVPTVKAVMSRRVFTVRPTTSVMETVQVMADKRVGSVVVYDTGPVGIFTEHDLINRVLKSGVSLEETEVGAVMTQPVVALKSGDSIARAVELMHDDKVSYIVVTDGEKLGGIVTMTDIRLKYSQGYMNAKLLLKKYADRKSVV